MTPVIFPKQGIGWLRSTIQNHKVNCTVPLNTSHSTEARQRALLAFDLCACTVTMALNTEDEPTAPIPPLNDEDVSVRSC